MSSSRLYADTHRKRQRYSYWRVLLVFILQTLIGTSYSISAEHTNNQTNDLTELRLSDTERLPLPPGDWRIELKTDFDFCRPSKQCSGTGGRAFLLHNLDLSTPVRVIVVRHTNRGVRNWRLNCYDRWSSFKDTHETQASGLTNKCSNGLDALVRYPTGYNDWWWEKFAPTFETLPKLSGWNTKFEIELNQQNKKGTAQGEKRGQGLHRPAPRQLLVPRRRPVPARARRRPRPGSARGKRLVRHAG